jgi:hypothetical protein
MGPCGEDRDRDSHCHQRHWCHLATVEYALLVAHAWAEEKGTL